MLGVERVSTGPKAAQMLKADIVYELSNQAAEGSLGSFDAMASSPEGISQLTIGPPALVSWGGRQRQLPLTHPIPTNSQGIAFREMVIDG